MKDPSFHALVDQSIYINVQFHYTQEHVDAKDVYFKYLPSTDMPADVMTKALAHLKHENLPHYLDLDLFVTVMTPHHHSEAEC